MTDLAQRAESFAVAARRYCAVVDSAANLERRQFLLQIYRILPTLIAQAMSLESVELPDTDDKYDGPSLRMTHEAWTALYRSLEEKLGDWNHYTKVCDPTEFDRGTAVGSLADDIADIYRDVKVGILLRERGQASWEEVVFDWRLFFYSHWGKHAIDALEVIHCRLSESLM